MFKWFNAPVGCIIRASATVLFLVRTNHLHYSYVCILEGGFRWFKHSWCLNCILSATHPLSEKPLQGLESQCDCLYVYRCTDTHTFLGRQNGHLREFMGT